MPLLEKALVVLSGGLDSTTVLALVYRRHSGNVETVTFNYGQRHDAEMQAAKEIADYYDVPWQLQGVTLGVGGVLMRHQDEMPHMTYEELEKSEGPSPTYVPYRNGTFLSLAASLALQNECETIYAGMHAEDAHNWAYPDCTPEFIGAMQNAIYVGTYHKVRLVVPFQYMRKMEIIRLGMSMPVGGQPPYNLTMSCYEGTRPACGKCPTCVARLEAFRRAGYRDPLEYANG